MFTWIRIIQGAVKKKLIKRDFENSRPDLNQHEKLQKV